MKPVIHRFLWLSMLLVLGMACYLDTVYAQEAGRGDQPTTSGTQAGETPGQGGMGETNMAKAPFTPVRK